MSKTRLIEFKNEIKTILEQPITDFDTLHDAIKDRVTLLEDEMLSFHGCNK